ncbi:hypothetical protein RUND412_006726 [Rhizina undulata]
MGNLCGKESNTEALPPGRVLGSATSSSGTSRLPASAMPARVTRNGKYKVGGPGRTLGVGSSSLPSDARLEAARAAMERSKATASVPNGSLTAQLWKQKHQPTNRQLPEPQENKQQLVWD